MPNIVGTSDEGVLTGAIGRAVLVPTAGAAGEDAALAFGFPGVTVTRNWLPAEFRPPTSLTLISTEDPLLAWLKYPSTAVANCCAKEFGEVLRPDELAIRLTGGAAASALVVA